MLRSVVALVATAALAVGSLTVAAPTSQAATPTQSIQPAPVEKAAKYKFKNCTSMNKVYPHGVGKAHAKDHTSGTPVTNFKHSTTLYKKIVGHRSGLDRDKDGIACEKH